MQRGCGQRRRQAGTIDSSAHAPRRGSLLADPTIRPKGAGPSIVARPGAYGIRGGGVEAFGQEEQGWRPELCPASPAVAAVTARVAAGTIGRPSRKRPRPGAAAAAAGTEGPTPAQRSRSSQRRSSPWGAAASLPSSPTAIVKRLLKLGLRLLPLLLGTSDVMLVGATATPTGSPTNPQGANAAGLPPAAGNAKIALNAATRTLASASSPKGAGRAPGGPKVIPPKARAARHHHHHHGQRLLDDHSLVKLLFLIIGLFWVLVVVALLYWAPVVSFLNLLVLSVIVLFIKSEGSSWLHHAQEHENRFWTVVAGVGAAVLLFSPDSPLAIGRWSRLLGILLTAAVAFAVHSYDRHLHRVNISRKPQFVRRTTRRTTSAATPSSSLGAASSGPNRGQHGRRGLSTNSLPISPSQPRSPPGSPPTSQRGPGHGLSTSLPASAVAAPSGVSGVGIGGLEAIVEGADGSSGVGRTQRAGPASSSSAAVSSPLGGTDAVTVKATPVAETRSLPLSPSLSAARSSPLPRSVPSAVSSPLEGQHKVEAVAALGAAATTAPTGDSGGGSLATSAMGSSIASGSAAIGDGSTGAGEGDGAGGRRGSLPTSPMGAIMTEAQPTSIEASAARAASVAADAAAAAAAESGVTETATAAPLVPSSSLSSSLAAAAAAAAGEEPKPQRLLGLLLESANTVDGEKMVLDAVARAAAEEKLEVVEHALKEVDQYLIASTITNYFNVQRVLRLERTIVNIFNAARTEELNFLVSHVPLGLLFYKVKDHTLTAYAGGSGGARCLNRTDLIEVLAVTRISELGIPERAMVLDALQQMKLTAHRQADKWVRNILLSTLGDSLSELKTLMDAKGDFQSLHKLIFDDIRSERVRHEILVHIRKQAQVQAAHMKLGTRLARQRRERQPWRKILSDVDDTLVSSGGRFPAGMDRRLPRHAVYPGVLAFYRELDLGVTEGADEWGPDRDQGNLVFLSARPHLYKDVSEKRSYAKFRRLQAERGMHTTPTLLAGSLDSGYSYVMERNIEGLAVKKMENFEQFVSLYPEYSFVFIGDNGQGDLRAAELMVKRARETPRHPRIDAVYIHRVQPLSRSYGYDEQAFCRWRDMGICFFENYIEAAVDAAVRRRPPLIRLTGLRRVVEAAVHDFAAIESWPSDRDRELRRVELNRSVLRANDVLARHGLAPVPCLPASTKARFEPGTRVMTLYGAGLVRRYRPEDGVYEVVLDWAATATATAATTSSSVKVKRLSLNGPSAAGSGGSVAATPLAVTPLSITPPRLEHRARSASIGAGPPSPLTLPPPKLRGISEGHQQQPSETSAAAALEWAEAGLSSPPGPHRSSLAPAPPPPTPSSVASLAGTPLPPMTPSMGSVVGGGASGPRSSLGGGPYAFPRVTVVAYLQEAAILQAIVPATKQQAAAAAAAASASNATAGLSSYISFFPGASYLTRLRSDRSVHRFAPGTAVRTPYGLGVVIQHRPAKHKPAVAATGAGASGAGEGSAKVAGAAPSAGPVGATAGAQAVGGAGGVEPVPATTPGAAAATTTATAVSSGASVSGGSVVAPAATAAVAQQPQPQQEAGETCVVQLKWGAKAYLPTSQLALASAYSLGAAGAAGLTSPRGGVSKGSSGGSTAGGVTGAASGGAESAGLLAGMMSLLSLGSNRGKPTGGASAAKPLLSSSASAPAGLVAREGQLLLVPGMAVTTKLGPAVVKERREADGVTVLALGAGPVAMVYVPAAGLTDFLTPQRRRKTGGVTAGALAAKEGTATPTNTSKRRSLSPRSGGGAAAGPSLLGFFKTTVKEEPPSEGASQPPPPPPVAPAVMVKEEPPSSPPLTPLPPQPRSRANSVDSEVSSIASTISTTSTGLRGWFARATATTTTTSTRSLHPEQQQLAGGSLWRRLAVGDRVSVGKLGEAVVLRVRDLDGVVEVAFTRWRGRAYLRREEVQPAQR